MRGADRVLILDGAMGTMLPRGRPPGEAVSRLHHAYLDAGADIITTSTFESRGHAEDVQAAALARAAADDWTRRTPDRPRRVAGAIGPIKPDPGLDLGRAYRQRVGALLEGGVDLILLETIVHGGSARAALDAIAAESASAGADRPLMISASLTKDGRLLSGEGVDAFYELARTAAPFSVGLNCSFGVHHLLPYVEALAALADCRVSCHPSAGLPGDDGRHPDTPEAMGAALGALAASGRLHIAGGCCGTTPDHVRAIAAAVADTPTR